MQPPQFGKKASTRDSIIKILSEEPLLSIKKLHERVTKNSGQSITYQAVHKCVLQLLEEGVLEKNGANFQISKKWLEEIKKFGEQGCENCSFYGQLKAGKKLIHLKFNSFVEWGQALVYDFFTYAPNPDNKPSVCCLVHTWSLVGASGQDFEAAKKVFGSTSHYSVTLNDTFLDQYFADLLNKMGKICITGVNLFPSELFVQGDFIAQVYYPPEWWQKISSYYGSIKSLKDIDLTKILQIYGSEQEVHVMIFEDKELSNFIRKRVLKEFSK